MARTRRGIAVAELLLVSPAAVFLLSIFVRGLQPQPLEPAHTAQQIVAWYVSLGPHVGLWGLLIGMPLATLILGCATLATSWQRDRDLRDATRQARGIVRAHFTTYVIASARTHRRHSYRARSQTDWSIESRPGLAGSTCRSCLALDRSPLLR